MSTPVFVPLPDGVATDDDCAALTWVRGRKSLTLSLNCYGDVSDVKCGLRNPPGGVAAVADFKTGWRWLCAPGEALPEWGTGEDQHTIGAWIDATFPGADPESPRKAIRTLEEVVELCLASGASAQDVVQAVIRTVHKEGLVHGTPEYLARRRRPEKIPAEAADANIVLLGLAQLAGFDLQAEIDKKMAINRGRRWKANGDGTGYHIKE